MRQQEKTTLVRHRTRSDKGLRGFLSKKLICAKLLFLPIVRNSCFFRINRHRIPSLGPVFYFHDFEGATPSVMKPFLLSNPFRKIAGSRCLSTSAKTSVYQTTAKVRIIFEPRKLFAKKVLIFFVFSDFYKNGIAHARISYFYLSYILTHRFLYYISPCRCRNHLCTKRLPQKLRFCGATCHC